MVVTQDMDIFTVSHERQQNILTVLHKPTHNITSDLGIARTFVVDVFSYIRLCLLTFLQLEDLT